MTNWFKVARADRDLIISRCGEKSSGVLAVWLAFCDIANRQSVHRFKSSGSEIARVAGLSRRTVERTLPILRALGLVTWEQTRNSETGGLDSNNYTLPTFHPPPTSIRNGTAKPSEPLPSDCRQPTDKDTVSPCRSLDGKTDKTGKTLFLQPASPTAGELPLPGESEQKPKAKAPRQPNPLFDALAELEGAGPEKLTASAAGKVGKALAEIKEASPDVTSDEIRRRAGNLRAHFPDATPTATSLAKHWARCAAPPAPRMNGNGRPSGELAAVETELRRMANASMREMQNAEWQKQKADLETRRAELKGEKHQ